MSLHYRVAAGGKLSGALRVPGDKSMSHRAIMFGAIADGVTEVSGFLEGEDAIGTMRAFRAMGVAIEGPNAGKLRIEGVGKHGLKAPKSALDLGNSGTSMRLLSGLLAGQRFSVEMIGDASLSKRPMNRVARPLRQMGASIDTDENGRPPLRLSPVESLRGIDFAMEVASAQVKSAVLLAGLYAQGQTCVTEPAPTRDHTERMLTAFGVRVERSGSRICIEGGQTLRAAKINIPADISSAAFFLVGAAISPGSALLLRDVGINPTRTGVIDILKAMGADIRVTNVREWGGEPVADLEVEYAPLRGIDIPEALVPLAIDEFPAIFIAAANAEGTTTLTGAAELRVKESDRIQVMADGLVTLGVDAQPTADGIRIRGGKYRGGKVDSHGDHRIAMAFAMAALRASGPIDILDCDNVATSFPGFAQLARQAGLAVEDA